MKMILLLLFLIFAFSMVGCAQENKYIELKDIIYDRVDGVNLMMDMKTLNDGRKNKSAVIAIHGGGWAGGGKEDSMWIGSPLADMGYTVFAITYRLTGVAPFPAQIEDCKAAVRHIRANAKNYNINPNKLAAYGASAGGHLACMLGVLSQGKFEGRGSNLSTSSAVQAVVGYSAPVDFNYFNTLPDDNGIKRDAFHWLFDKTKEGIDYWLTPASPITYIDKKSAPHLMLYGSTDDLVPLVQGRPYQKKLQDKGVFCDFYVEEGAWHILTPEFVYPKIEVFLKKFIGD